TAAPTDELLAIGDALAGAGHGVFEVVADHPDGEAQRTWMVELARRTGATLTYALAQVPYAPAGYRDALADADQLAADGLRVVPQVSCRPTGMLFGLQSSLHPFITHPTYRSLSALPLGERGARLREPDALREMMTHRRTVLGLSDGGAHCGLICDASMPTYLLTHWVRDRVRGERLALEQAVHLQTGRTAAVYGLTDRGTVEPGKRADLNLVDLDGLRLHAPEMVFDLPAGGRRLVQRVEGYPATFVAGEPAVEA